MLPPTFRCWFCVGEKRLGEKVPYSRTLPICRNCQEHYTSVASEPGIDTHPTAAISGSASRLALPSPSSYPPRPTHLGFQPRPLRPAVVIDTRKGLRKKIILRFRLSKKPDCDPTSSNGVQQERRAPTSNERREEILGVRQRLPRPILFLSLPNPTGEDGGKILLSFQNPLRNNE